MNLDSLLRKLAQHSIKVAEIREVTGKAKIYTLTCPMPAFPFGRNQHRWYSLTVFEGQDFVEREEIDALLRHFWQLQIDIFEDGTEDRA